MTIDEVINWYGNLTQACYALDIAFQNTTKWKAKGYVPWRQQLRIEIMTKGKLVADKEDPFFVLHPTKSRKTRKPRKKKCLPGTK